ncbi:hypothetical protein L1987_13329 [Smallanthus sonchifolius]|uniref:Uncharacterized protein n=1 Tax=Smallanthus sonchifolius TaxID=185202 RepID=A0ACB9JIB0_9ASTR|nr:hypothetical protein L1987_13329 [Smallanthus sonchifolius]
MFFGVKALSIPHQTLTMMFYLCFCICHCSSSSSSVVASGSYARRKRNETTITLPPNASYSRIRLPHRVAVLRIYTRYKS